jgi:hypothetical protein
MTSPTAPSGIAADSAARSNSRLATQLYWLTGLAPIATNVVTPLMVFWQMRRGDKSPMVKYNQQVNEVGRQFVSGTIGLISYFGGGEVTRGVLKALNGIGINLGQPMEAQQGQNPDDAPQKVAMLLGGILMSFIGFAVIRPLVGTQLICKFLKKESGVEAALGRQQLEEIMAGEKSKPEMDAMIRKKLAAVAKADSGQAMDGFPIRQIQRWVDKHLFEPQANGEPKPLLGKAAGVATLALTTWLTGLTGLLYGLNQALGGRHAPRTLGMAVFPDVKPGVQSGSNIPLSGIPPFSPQTVATGVTIPPIMPVSGTYRSPLMR